MEMIIDLNSISRVKDFVKITQNFPYDMYLKSGQYTIDAKSIMGIFSLNLGQPLTFVLDINDLSVEEVKQVIIAIQSFEAE